ncbi:DoxX family protein [Actinomadura sp. CNU-125]|uniref:DoxX family protein n=1 Tax=Actinomadura sp. CNU-125 TaxID=1904961 RepID=UPI001177D583|nr:DoxX family protein [Actinomadura sp. CNU-125]
MRLDQEGSLDERALVGTQGISAYISTMSPLEKLSWPIVEQAVKYPWVRTFPATARSVGVLELLGAVGSIVSAVTRGRPRPAPAARTGLAILMALAAAMYLRRKELSDCWSTPSCSCPLHSSSRGHSVPTPAGDGPAFPIEVTAIDQHRKGSR